MLLRICPNTTTCGNDGEHELTAETCDYCGSKLVTRDLSGEEGEE